MNPMDKQLIWEAILEGVKSGHVNQPIAMADALMKAHERLFNDPQCDRHSLTQSEDNEDTEREHEPSL